MPNCFNKHHRGLAHFGRNDGGNRRPLISLLLGIGDEITSPYDGGEKISDMSSYIDPTKLIRAMMGTEPVDAMMILSNAKREKVLRALERSKDGVPQPLALTNQRMEEENLSRMPRRDKKRLWAIYDRLNETPGEVISGLLALRRRYPEVPAIYNYLGIAYKASGREKRYVKTLLETVERFPDYLFGKTSLAEYYLDQEQNRKVREVFEGKFELRQHYPTTEVFHISEVRSFFSVVGTFFARVNNISRALYHYFILSDLEPDHPATRRVANEIVLKEMSNITSKIRRNVNLEKRRRTSKR